MTDKQLRYLKARIEGHNKQQSKLLANYDPTTSTSQIEEANKLKSELKKSLFKQGFNDEYISSKLMLGTKARKTHYYTDKGIVVDSREVEDHESQYKYLRLGCELRGDLQEKNVEVNLGLISLGSNKMDENEWNKGVE